jgi:aspartate aminotransferase
MFSDRVMKIDPSSTVSLMNKEEELRKKGLNIVSFSVGEPDFRTPIDIIEAAYEAMLDGKTHYTNSNGIEPLRIAIANKYTIENKVNANYKNVLVTPTKLGLYMAIAAHVNKNDEVLLPDPGWVSYHEMVKLNDGKPVSYTLDESKGYALNQESIKQKLNKNTKIILINTPSNPTGSILSLDDLRFLNDIAEDNNIIILSDEIYEKIIYEGEHVSIGSLDKNLDHTIIVNGFSKSYAMTGWRLGYLIASEPEIYQINKLQQQTITCSVSFAQYAAVNAFKNMQSVRNMVAEFLKRRNLISKLLKDLGIFEFDVPKATFYLFPKFDYKNLDDIEFTEFLLDKAQVSLTPGSAFGENGKGHVRFSFATNTVNIEEGVRRIKNVL